MRVNELLELNQKVDAAIVSDSTVGNHFLGAWGSATVAGYKKDSIKFELFIGAYLRDFSSEICCDRFGKIIKVS